MGPHFHFKLISHCKLVLQRKSGVWNELISVRAPENVMSCEWADLILPPTVYMGLHVPRQNLLFITWENHTPDLWPTHTQCIVLPMMDWHPFQCINLLFSPMLPRISFVQSPIMVAIKHLCTTNFIFFCILHATFWSKSVHTSSLVSYHSIISLKRQTLIWK